MLRSRFLLFRLEARSLLGVAPTQLIADDLHCYIEFLISLSDQTDLDVEQAADTFSSPVAALAGRITMLVHPASVTRKVWLAGGFADRQLKSGLLKCWYQLSAPRSRFEASRSQPSNPTPFTLFLHTESMIQFTAWEKQKSFCM